jgi:hypothetical protein
VFEHDALIRLHAIEAALKLTGDGHVGGIRSVVVNAGIALLIGADLQIGLAGAGDEDAQVGREQYIGILAGCVAGFDGSAIEGDHKGGVCRRIGWVCRCVLREVHFGRGAKTQLAASCEGDMRRRIARSDGSVVSDTGFAVRHGERARK